MAKKIKLPDIPEADQIPLVKVLLGIIEQLADEVQQLEGWNPSKTAEQTIDIFARGGWRNPSMVPPYAG